GLVDAALTRTFDDDSARAGKVAHRHGGQPAPTLEALLDAVDVVWVCTWTAAHLAAVEAAAARGLPVFCEKPLAPDLAAAERVTRALERVPHQVGLVLRWAPVFRHLAARIASGEFGRVLATSMRDDQYYPIQGLYGSTCSARRRCCGPTTTISGRSTSRPTTPRRRSRRRRRHGRRSSPCPRSTPRRWRSTRSRRRCFWTHSGRADHRRGIRLPQKPS